MHFTYEENIKKDELMQGDVLERTPPINSLLEQVHPHFFHNAKNRYFMVLTQSCDLVLRGSERRCKAPYISIAPIRDIDYVVDRYFADSNTIAVKAELPVISDRMKSKFSEFLMRLFNNNEPGYFFLEGSGTPLGTDCAAFLNLSIALKSDLHFKSCLDAKILQLRSEFQAKLGWLVGQLYSRVGTEDWGHSELTKKTNDTLKDAAICVPDSTVKYLEEHYKKSSGGDGNVKMTPEEIASAIKQSPKRKDIVINAAVKIIEDVLGERKTEAMLKKIKSRLESDGFITSILK